jgi:hypothetical protein
MSNSLIESEESYSTKKYYEWVKLGCRTLQDKDPSFIPCSFCGRRTEELKLRSINHKDYLICKKHKEFKGE